MSIRSWWTGRRRNRQAAYDKNHGYATADEQTKLKRRKLGTFASGGMPEGTGISPTGTPMDFTADDRPPKY
jgi:hypothetical protein